MRKLIFLYSAAVSFPLQLAATGLELRSNYPSYPANSIPSWTVSVEPSVSSVPISLACRWKLNGYQLIGSKALTLTPGEPQTLRVPQIISSGTVLLEIDYTDNSGKKQTVKSGCAVAAELLQPARPEPSDFLAFWKAKVARLDHIPMAPKIKELPNNRITIQVFELQLDSIEGRSVHAQLAVPDHPTGKFPALILLQWAGVYPLQQEWVLEHARAGWLVVNVMPHDLPIYEKPDFYEKQAEGPLLNYFLIGRENPDSSYFLNMILAAKRAADYITSRKEWDGHTLVAKGTSQGGYLAIALAAIHSRVTSVIANVPAGCDQAGRLANRATGFPNVLADKVNPENQDTILTTSDYYDAVNFAKYVRVPAMIGTGLADTVCPPSGVLVMANQIQAPVELVLMPDAGHDDTKHAHAAFINRSKKWLDELKASVLPPISGP